MDGNPGNFCSESWTLESGILLTMKFWGAYHLTEKSGWGVESIMISNLPVYRRNATSVTV